jgi:uncharacterized cupin superfamily protein
MNSSTQPPLAILATDVAPRTKASSYPEPFASMMEGRIKRPLGDIFGLKNFGVNLTVLKPGAVSALHHVHSRQDEFVYVIEGEPTLFLGETRQRLSAGHVVGFPANGAAHHLQNETAIDVVILEIGDRSPGDQGSYPTDDLKALMTPNGWAFTHKDGTPYSPADSTTK